MKPLALFGSPHNALVYVFLSHMRMPVCMHMLPLHSIFESRCEGIKGGTKRIVLQEHAAFYLFIDPVPHSVHSAQ